MSTFISRIIQRLEAAVIEETELLEENAIIDLQDFNTRKSHGLYDLSRALDRLDRQSLDPATLAKLHSLRLTLASNQAALSVHLQAVREIAAVISGAIRDSESDGTYAPPFGRVRGTP